MAIPYLTNVDLNKNQILNHVLQIIAGDHGSPVEGIIWYDGTGNVVKFYDGTDIQTLGISGSGGDADTLDGLDSVYFLARANHTGTQLAATISDFDTAVAAELSGYALETYVDTAISNLVDAAPGTLDTLNELAAALGDDASFSTTITNLINAKPSKYSVDIGDNSTTAIVITHSLGSRDVNIQVRRATTPWDTVMCDVERTSTTTATLRFAIAPTTNQFRVTVIGG